MPEHSNQYEAEPASRRPTVETPPSNRSVELQCIVVRYETRPDRCTITPKSCPKSKQLTAWLSADRDVFVDLEAAR